VIDFGVQLKFSINEEEIPLNIYFSSKKGISTVIGGAPNNKLRPLLQKILDQRIDPVRTDHNWKLWAGTDESGKGDFFGPLVVCGFICNQAMLPTLKKLGVKDSKLLKDGDIEKIAKQLYARFFVNIETIILHPSKYNELYEQFRKQNKKLNELLAWMHGRVILNLKKNHKFEGAVVDRFASDKTLLSSLKDLKKIKLQHRIKAEDDLAVASASIIARYLFLKKMKELSEKYDLELPKGASEKVVKTASEFVAKYGKEKLREVAKIHFKTFQKI
jgi:ribonuclease HIII